MDTKKKPIHQTSREGYAFLLLSVALAIYSLVLHMDSNAKWKMSPYLFPLVLSVFLFILSLTLLQEGKKECKDQRGEDLMDFDPKNANPSLDTAIDPLIHGKHKGLDVSQKQSIKLVFASLMQQPWKDSLVFALITALYIMSIALVGFVVATTLFLALSFVYLKERRKWLLLVLSLSFPLVVYVLFGMLLHVMLP